MRDNLTDISWSARSPLSAAASVSGGDDDEGDDETKSLLSDPSLTGEALRDALAEDVGIMLPTAPDVYGFGKLCARMARLAIIADEIGRHEEGGTSYTATSSRYQIWLGIITFLVTQAPETNARSRDAGRDSCCPVAICHGLLNATADAEPKGTYLKVYSYRILAYLQFTTVGTRQTCLNLHMYTSANRGPGQRWQRRSGCQKEQLEDAPCRKTVGAGTAPSLFDICRIRHAKKACCRPCSADLLAPPRPPCCLRASGR